MQKLQQYKSQILFHLYLNVITLCVVTYSGFYHIPFFGWKDRFYYLILLLISQFTVFGFLYFLSLNKIIFKIFFPILFLIFGIAAFWTYSQDIIINDGVIQATLETKPDVVTDLISYQFIYFIFFLLILIVFSFYLLNKVCVNQLKSPLIIIASFGVLSFFVIQHFRTSTLNNRPPYSLVYGIKNYFSKSKISFIKIKKPLTAEVQNLNVIFVLGESVRADHLSINGYRRITTPNLQKIENLISFKNAYTTKTYTAISVPQILSNESINDGKSTSFTSLIDVLNAAKISTTWIGNQTPEKSYENFINASKEAYLIDPYHSEFSYHKQLDEKMLPILFKNFKTNTNQFITMHMMGSHWYYENRYSESFRKFLPVIKSKYIPSNSSEEMVNSYDNTILYLDYFLAKTIREVNEKNSNTILIYLSDHGEALGENGSWLHAQETNASKNPALLVWYSDRFKSTFPKIVLSLNAHKDQKISLDFFFNSIIDLYQIKGIPYKRSESLFQY